MKKELNETFKVYGVLAKDCIPQIPYIDAHAFAKQIAQGQRMSEYMSHLLACDQREYSTIALILISHGYQIEHIETFDCGFNKCVYFKIKP